MNLNVKSIEDRLNRLTDAYLDAALDRPAFEQRKATLLLDKKQQDERLREIRNGNGQVAEIIA